MAVSPAKVFDANTRIAELRKRRAWWLETVLKPLTHSATLAPSARYQYRLDYKAALTAKTRLKYQAQAVRFLGQVSGHAETNTAKLLVKKNLPPKTDLVALRADHAAADTDMKAIEGRLHTFAAPPLAGEANFFKKVHAALAKGDHVKASALIKSKQPPIFKRVFMSAGDKAAYTAQLNILAAKVNAHQSATERRDTAKKATAIVEKETAKSIAKLLRKDSKHVNDAYHRILRKAGRSTIDPSDPDIIALAGRDKTMALLIKYAGKDPSAKDIQSAIARSHGVITFESVRHALHELETIRATHYKDAKNDLIAAEQKYGDCKRFIRQCRHAMRHELSAARGGVTVGKKMLHIRHDLIDELEEAVKPGSTATDAEVQALIDKVDARKKHWATANDITDIEFDRDLLKVPSSFDRTKMHPVAMPEFNVVSRVKEHVVEVAKNTHRIYTTLVP